MSAGKPQPSLADYVAIAICPTLIMALVGSLVFFLLEVLYHGKYDGRLQWILFSFVFATVLIARMSMMPGIAERSGLYGIALAVVVWLALQKFVAYPPDNALAQFDWAVNLALMGIIWWCAHRLTWDCTQIDENVDSSGAGLLEVAGLEENSGPPEMPQPEDCSESKKHRAEGGGLGAWWERYRRYREERSRLPHAPGVWIIYFSLAALPLFGLGQSLIPPDNVAGRRYAFWLMAVYVASGLGLLLTTSFLGLRRYLRQRRLQMSRAITGTWLALGGLFILVLLAAGAFLPRPNAEYALIRLGGSAGPKDQQASHWAVGGGDAGQGQGRPGGEGSPDGQGGGSRSGSGSGSSGGSQSGSGSGGNSSGRGSGSSEGSHQSGSGGGSSQGNSGSGQSGSSGQSGQEKSGSGSQAGGQQGRSGNANQSGQGGQKPESGASGQGGAKPVEHPQGKDAADSSEGDQTTPDDGGSFSLQSLFTGLAKLVKVIVFTVLAVAVAFILLRAIVNFLANFTGWAKKLRAALENLWQALFGWWLAPAQAAKEEPPPEAPRPRPFASYPNPFAGGPGQRSAEELVRYSFEALEAWAREHGQARQRDDTPLEFAERLADDVPPLAADARRLAVLYARAAYARGRLPASSTDFLRQFWERLENLAEAPLSA